MPNNDMSISVVIPAYNAEDTLEECVESVLKQSRTDCIKEVIIVNDGSDDDTQLVAEEMRAQNKSGMRITIINQKNKGVSAARNAGIEISSSKWVALLDSDDQWSLEKIELSVQVIVSHPEIAVLGTNRSSFMRSHGKQVDANLYKLSTRDELWKPWPTTSSLMIRRDVIDEVGAFEESRTHAEDVDLLLRITPRYGVHYLYQPLLIFADKASYGDRGLSANMDKMHRGFLQNIKNSRGRGDISSSEYVFFSMWERVKYLRRILKIKLGTVK